MITQNLLKYIEIELAKGTPKNIIESRLLSNGGWNLKDVAEGFSAVILKKYSDNHTPPPPPPLARSIANSQNIIQPAIPIQNNQKQTGQSYTPTTKKPPSHALGIIIVLIICAFIGGGLYYYKYLDFNFLTNNTQNQIILDDSAAQKTNGLNSATNSAEQTNPASSSDKQPATDNVYKNTKFGYQLILNNKWHIPLKFNALYDLIIENPAQSSQPTEAELQKWKSENANNVVLTDASQEEEQIFYDQLNKGQISDPLIFPGNSIIITLANTASSYKNLVSTTTATRIITKIIVNNKYDGFMTQNKPGATIHTISISVRLTNDSKLSDNNAPNMINFLTHQVPAEDLLKLVNTLVY